MANSGRPGTAIAFVYRGTFVHSTQRAALQILEDALLGVDTQGKVCGTPEYLKSTLVLHLMLEVFNLKRSKLSLFLGV